MKEMKGNSKINRADRKRWERMFSRYIAPVLPKSDYRLPSTLKSFENLQLYGWQKSILQKKCDYEFRHTPPEIRKIFRKVSIMNHFLNELFFIDSFFRNNKNNKKERRAFEIEMDIFAAMFYCLWPEMGKIKQLRQNCRETLADDVPVPGHCEAGSILFTQAKVFENIESNRTHKKMIKYSFAPAKRKTAEWLISGEYWGFRFGPSVFIHAMNLKARWFELRHYFTEWDRYWESLALPDKQLIMDL